MSFPVWNIYYSILHISHIKLNQGVPISRWPTIPRKDGQFDITVLGVGRPNWPSARQMQLSADRRQRTFDRLRMHPRWPEWPQRATRRHRVDRVLGVAFPYDSRRRVPSVSPSPTFVVLQLPRERYRARRVSRPESIRVADLPRHEDPRGEDRVVPPLAES